MSAHRHAHLAALSGHYASLGAAATPGPWHAIEPLAGGDLPRAHYLAISGECWTDFAGVVISVHGTPGPHPEGLANARLIAAVPDLLRHIDNLQRALNSAEGVITGLKATNAVLAELLNRRSTDRDPGDEHPTTHEWHIP